MLGADVVVQQPIRFLGGILQYAFGFRAEGNLDRGGHLLPKNSPSFDFLADRLKGQVGPGKDTAREPLPFPDQPQQEVLGLNRDTPKLAGLVSREEKDTSRPFGIPFEHPKSYVKGVRSLGIGNLLSL
jgi:hypothetical protein